MNARGPHTLSVDIGGTGMKMLVLDASGVPVNERIRERTPRPSLPGRVVERLLQMAASQPSFDRVSVGFPGVVREGVVATAPNLDTEIWRSFALEQVLTGQLGRPVRVINDADLQGYGVVSGDGVELVLTLGTGLGAALFTRGHLVPNLELGHHPFKKGQTYEQRVSEAALDEVGKQRWSRRVGEMFDQLAPIFNYDTLYLGGGNARKLKLELPSNVKLFENQQGLRGGIRLWDHRH